MMPQASRLLQELGVAQVALGAEAGRAQRQRLLRLHAQTCKLRDLSTSGLA